MTSSLKQIPLYHLELVRDRSIEYTSMIKTEQRAQVLHELLDRSPVEQLIVMYLNASGDLVGVEKVGLGGVVHVAVTMAEIFRGAILASVPSIVMGHNHVDDNLTPSEPDWQITSRATLIGEQLGIFVEDHIIVGPGGKHLSMRAQVEILERIERLGFSTNDFPNGIGSYKLDTPVDRKAKLPKAIKLP